MNSQADRLTTFIIQRESYDLLFELALIAASLSLVRRVGETCVL